MYEVSRQTDGPAECLARLPVASHAVVNEVVRTAVATWPIASRVLRLVTPSYLYEAADFDHFSFIGAYRGEHLLGIAAVDRQPGAAGADTREWLLHGLFVRPDDQGTGTGTRLVDAVTSEAARAGVGRILVKAERHAVGFFEKRGFCLLEVTDPTTDYPYRLTFDIAANDWPVPRFSGRPGERTADST